MIGMTMSSNWRYCPQCGAKLDELSVPARLWLKACRCSSVGSCGAFYLEKIDGRNIYPLVVTYPNIPDILKTASQQVLDLALSRIRIIDYKTVSLVDFERTLLGVYEKER